MKTTIKGLEALQIALRNRVERLPDGVAIRMYNDIHHVTIGDIAAIIEASGGVIRFDNTGIYFGTSRNQAKRLCKRLQDWVEQEIERHQGECFTPMLNILEDVGREKEKQLLEAIRKDREAGKFDGGNRMAQLITERKAKEAAKDSHIQQLENDLTASNLLKDGALKSAQKALDERNEFLRANFALQKELGKLKAENAQLREALASMTRLRDEAAGKSVRLPKEGDEIEYRNTESSPWKTCTVAVRPHGRPYAPDRFGLMYLEVENHGILWRWPQPQGRAAADAKPFDNVWLVIGGKRLLGKIDHFDGAEVVCAYSQAAGWRRQARMLIDLFGKTWGFAD